MTRFNELARIERAIKYRDKAELQWALGYCRMRVSFSERKEGVNRWRKIEEEVTKVLESENSSL
jgi:hypothetical protein